MPGCLALDTPKVILPSVQVGHTLTGHTATYLNVVKIGWVYEFIDRCPLTP